MLDPQATRFGQAALLSGLMDAEGLSACWEAIPPEKREAPEHIDRRLARQALLSGALTLWQAQQLLAGRSSGFKVDRYVLLELIGQGGMGRVYLARDTRLNRRVALKILAPERISNPRAVARFQREARVGAQLQHENLVRVYDFGESNGRYFLVMEYIEGKTIGHLISDQGPLPPATAARLVRQVALGLAHADRKGLIHRDVNPYNILVTHDGVAKLADLGLAIDLSEVDRVTREGATVGTFDYVAPEQARHSHAADIRSDIYSLGCTLYHMLTGQVPFPCASLPEKLLAHQAAEPTPPEQLVPGLPSGLGDVVRTMMRKPPEERYASPAQVVQALEAYIDEGPAAGRVEPSRPSSGSAARPGPAGRSASSPGSENGARPAPGLPASPPDGAGTGDPMPGRGHALAATAAGPAPTTTIAATPTPTGSDPDEPGLPMLTPTDDLPVARVGLSIVVDLGPDPPLRPAPARPRSLFSRSATSTGSGEIVSGTAPRSRWAATWRAWPRWGRVAVPASAVAAVALIALLAAPGRLTPPDVPRRSPDPAGRAGRSDPDGGRTRTSQPRRAAGAAIVVLSTGAEREVPAATLADAVRLAMGSGKAGLIELRNREPLKLGPSDVLDLNTGRGSLRIRAGEGLQPVVEVRMDPDRPFVSTGSAVSLSLAGLTIRVRHATTPGAGSGERPPLLHAAGRVQVDRCAFEVEGARPDGCRALVVDGGDLTVDRCWFLGFDRAIRIKSYGETATRIRRTMIVPESGVAASGPAPELRGWALGVELLPGRAAATSKRQLILEHCTIEGAGLLDLGGDAGAAPLAADVSHCAVRAEALLSWQTRNPGGRLATDLTWRGRGNQFQVLGPRWVVPAAAMRPVPSPEVTDLESWRKLGAHEDQPIRTRILYRTDPDRRSDSPRPEDFAIESTVGRAEDRAGADPEQVGPWGR